MDEDNEKRRKKRFPILIILFFFLILSYFLFSSILIDVPVKRSIVVDKPNEVVREVTTTQQYQKYVCTNRTFRYSTLGGNVDTIGNTLRPNLQITNDEEQWGYFRVNFSYIDESKFPYDTYGGQNLQQSLDSGAISSEDADAHSPTFGFYLGPGEAVLLNNRTLSPSPGNKYWAIADIEAPSMEVCNNQIRYENVTANRTFTEYVKSTETRWVKQNKSVTEILGINNFFSWILLMILLAIIILLIQKIRKERSPLMVWPKDKS